MAAAARHGRRVACPARGMGGEGRSFYSVLLFSCLVLRLLPGMGGRSPARRGAWGERGKFPSTPPAPPYSPFCGNAEGVSFMRLYPVRRVSRGASARTFPGPMGRGDVRACCGAPFALRASGIAFAPAPSLHQDRGRRGEPYQTTRGGGPAAEMRPDGCFRAFQL